MPIRMTTKRRRELAINIGIAVVFLILFAATLYAYELQLAANWPQ